MRAHAAVLQLNWLVGGLPTQACMVASDHTAGRRSDTPLNKECVSDVVEQDGARLGVNRGTAERSGLLPRASWATRGKLQRPREAGGGQGVGVVQAARGARLGREPDLAVDAPAQEEEGDALRRLRLFHYMLNLQLKTTDYFAKIWPCELFLQT